MAPGAAGFLSGWLLWLQNGVIGQAMRQSALLYPAVEILHILGFALLLGSIVALDLRVLGLGRVLAVADLADHLLPIAVGGFLLAVVTGSLLFATEAASLFDNLAFRTKLVLLAAAGANAAVLHAHAWRGVDRWGASAPRPARVAAALSILFWAGVLICGRLIAYF